MDRSEMARNIVSGGFRAWKQTLLLLFLVLVLTFLTPHPAVADYVVQPGDVLEITVPGLPGLHRRVPVDASGQLSLPLIGDLNAAGKSVSALRTALRDLLVKNNVIRDPEVIIEVADYRPVYVGGDISKPGAYSYRPGMTVRDAVALAGGYDPLHLRGRDPMMETVNARGDYEALAVNLAKQAVRVARLKAELANRQQIDLSDLANLPVKPESLQEIARFESQQLAADHADNDREKAFLSQMMNKTKDQLNALRSEQQQDAAALAQQSRNLARARELMRRGLLQNSRLEELERAVSGAQSQTFEVQARIAQTQKELDDFTRKLQTVDDQRRIRLLGELRDAVAQSAITRSQFEATAERIRYSSSAQMGNPLSLPADRAQVRIYRMVGGEQQEVKADQATSLSPGDNVEITVKAKFKNQLIRSGMANRLPAQPAAMAPATVPVVQK